MRSSRIAAALAVAALALLACATAVEAQAPSGRVTSIPLLSDQIASYAGYITVDKPTGSNLFFWLFEALDANPATAPLLIWLNGGPGSSSMYGLFDELGPFSVAEDGQSLRMREHAWSRNYSVMFIDNPVGTGFSYTKSPNGFVTDQQQVGRDLLTFLYEFYRLYPQFQKVPLYICGESYAGKYVPAFAYAVHNANTLHAEFMAAHPGWKASKQQRASEDHTAASPAPFNVPNAISIPLAGIAIGDGMMDPLTQIPGYGDFLFQLSMIDDRQRDFMRGEEAKIIQQIKSQQWKDAFHTFDKLMMSDLFPYPSYFTNVTGLTDYFNFNTPVYQQGNFARYLNRADVKAALHVAPDFVYVSGNETVEEHMLTDFMQSVKPWVETLLEHYPVLIYSGQNDIILSPPQCENFLSTLKWSQSSAWASAPRQVWRIQPKDYEVAGYVRQQATPLGKPGLTYVILRGAGHLVPQDQPERAIDMMDRWIQRRPFKG